MLNRFYFLSSEEDTHGFIGTHVDPPLFSSMSQDKLFNLISLSVKWG